MWAVTYDHLHVLQWLQEDGATWDCHVISCAEECGYNYVVEWARENGCPEPCGFVESRHELGKKMQKSGNLQKFSTKCGVF
jgi:hypothetical protein